jgi:hypothetical protein
VACYSEEVKGYFGETFTHFYVECEEFEQVCHCKIGPYPTLEKAIATWNRRTPIHKWTREHPTQPGQYWWYGANAKIRNEHNIDKPEIAQICSGVDKDEDELEVVFDNDQGDILSESLDAFCAMFEDPFWLRIEDPGIPEDEKETS